MTCPVLLIVAGPNGSGKTTVTQRLRSDHWSEGVEYLNPDEVARDRFGDWNSPEAVGKALKWTQGRREELLAQRRGIAFETVFSAPDKIDFMLRAKDVGYFVRVFFVGTLSPSINAARVTRRVLEGGHTVPLEKIVSRYTRSMANLAVALRAADRAYVYDNSVENVDAFLMARTSDGGLRKIYGALPRWIEDAIEGLPAHPELVDLRGG